MPVWQSERVTVNQRVQIGSEAAGAHGVAVPANKILQCFSFDFGIAADILAYGATGRKYDLILEENAEWVDGTMSGPMDYNGLVYPFSSAMGAITPVAHGASLVAKDWVFTPPVSGSLEPTTFTFQQGDTTRAHQLAYSLFTKFNYKATRKDFTCSASLMANNLTDGITMTASPTAVALAPIPAKQLNVYLDPTFAALGTTQLLRVLSADYAFDSIYGPLWVLNRSNISYLAHVDHKPKAIMKLKVEADAAGMALLPLMQSSATYFMRVNAIGSIIDNLQTVALGAPSAGTFTLTYKGQTTTAIAYNATSAAVQAALIALSTIGAGNVTVTGAAGGPYSVAFAGILAQDATAMTGSGVGLTGGAFLITQAQAYNVFQHDMAVKVGKPSTFGDDQGVFAIDWELFIVEDAGWGKAQSITLTNLLTAL